MLSSSAVTTSDLQQALLQIHDPAHHRGPQVCQGGTVSQRTRAVGGVAVAAAAFVGVAAVLRDRQLRWGATPEEVVAVLPGDAILPTADLVATRAIGVAAPATAVWPWLAQMGQGRGGLYSYDWLENLVGCQMHSADEIVEQWQDIKVGDAFRLHPDVALRIGEVDPPRALVVRGGVAPDGRTTDEAAAAPYDFTWAFVLTEQGPDRSRLIVRERYQYLAPWTPLLVEPVSAISFVMTQRMLRGIGERAEAAASRR